MTIKTLLCYNIDSILEFHKEIKITNTLILRLYQIPLDSFIERGSK